MRTLLFTFLMATMGATPARSEIIFDHIKDEAWKQEVLATMTRVHSQLPKEWEPPARFTIVYAEGYENSYYPIFRYKDETGTLQTAKQVLIVGNDNQATFIHEYAHAVMDHWLRKNSLPWQYFMVWQEFGYQDLVEVRNERIEKLPSLKAAHFEYQDKKSQGDHSKMVESAIFHTERSILQYEAAIEQIGEVLEKTKDYPHSLTAFNSFTALAPYNELFADAVAALLMDDWHAVRKDLEMEITNMDLETLVLPPLENQEDSISAFLSYREFLTDFTISTYSFQDWESTSTYWQFQPFRSEFRRWVEKENIPADQAIDQLGKAIFNIYETSMMVDPQKVDQPLMEKNLQLRNALWPSPKE